MNLAKNWKNFALVAAGALAVVSLAACGKSASGTKSSDASANLNKKQTITLWTFTTEQPQIDELKNLNQI